MLTNVIKNVTINNVNKKSKLLTAISERKKKLPKNILKKVLTRYYNRCYNTKAV